MKYPKSALLFSGLIALSCAGLASTWSTTTQFGEYDFGNGYGVNNDIWGSGAGSQTLYVDTTSSSAPHFWATANHPQGSGNVKAYPDARIAINKTVSSLGRLVGTFDTGANEGVCDFGFDCWIPSEVMVWTQWTNTTKPNGSLYQSNVSISGVTYNVWHGSYWTFERASQSASGSADLAAIFKWLVNNGHLADGTVGECEYGVEIVSGNSTWTVHSCSITQ